MNFGLFFIQKESSVLIKIEQSIILQEIKKHKNSIAKSQFSKNL